jgi:hypothetical protein
MAQDWSVHALVYFYSASSYLPWAVSYWRLDMESADMKTIIEMAREAGLIVDANQSGFDSVEAFAALVRADEREQGQKWFDAVLEQHKIDVLAERSAGVKAEREACAKVCDARAIEYDGFSAEQNASEKLAAAIRARGQA